VDSWRFMNIMVFIKNDGAVKNYGITYMVMALWSDGASWSINRELWAIMDTYELAWRSFMAESSGVYMGSILEQIFG
jgi:hypothetical protein